MSKPILLLALAGAALTSPAVAGSIYTDSNHHYLDYKTDISEAQRELRSDLARANDAADREDAWAEYQREVADARHDFRKEMAERGHPIRRGTVLVTDD